MKWPLPGGPPPATRRCQGQPNTKHFEPGRGLGYSKSTGPRSCVLEYCSICEAGFVRLGRAWPSYNQGGSADCRPPGTSYLLLPRFPDLKVSRILGDAGAVSPVPRFKSYSPLQILSPIPRFETVPRFSGGWSDLASSPDSEMLCPDSWGFPDSPIGGLFPIRP